MGEVLLFIAGPVRGAIPLADTDAAVRMVQCGAPAADAFPWDAGTVNHHGTLVRVLAVRALFGIPVPNPGLSEMLIIARAGDMMIALRVDAIAGTQKYPSVQKGSEPVKDSQEVLPGLFEMPDGFFVIRDLALLIGALEKRGVSPIVPSLSENHEAHHENDHQLSGSESITDEASVTMLLEERARILALPATREPGKNTREIIRFRLANQEFGIALAHIREVVLTGRITRVPGTPSYIAGISIIRGEIISLVDLRILLPIPHTGITDLNRVIVVSGNSLTLGILADQITGIGELDAAHLSTQGDAGSGPRDLVNVVHGGTLTLIDTEALFSDPRMTIDDP